MWHWQGFWWTVLLGLLAAAALGTAVWLLRRLTRGSTSRSEEVVMEETMKRVTDPVCGMSFKPEKAAAQATHNGKTYHFCTDACKTQFDEDPERYVEPHGGPRPVAGTGSED